MSRLEEKHVAKKNWFVRIAEARERGVFTDQDKLDAADWTTCACGEQDPRIPRVGNTASDLYRPEDKLFAQLGVNFYFAVNRDEFDDAEKTLHAIERRATEVLQEATGS